VEIPPFFAVAKSGVTRISTEKSASGHSLQVRFAQARNLELKVNIREPSMQNKIGVRETLVELYSSTMPRGETRPQEKRNAPN
jgi:hypothetical protein